MDTVLLYIVGILIIVIGLALSIGLHEIGHLVPAKLFGVKVGQYMIGFGPTLWSRRHGETEYGVKAIPLGGYISMAGMYPPQRPGGKSRAASTGFFDTMVQDARTASAETITSGDEHRVFYKLPIYKRIIIMLGGPFMNLVIAVVLYSVLFMGFGISQPSTTLGSISECVLPAGSAATSCSADDPLAPGAEAGLEPGDRLIAIEDAPIQNWAQATGIIRDNAGRTIDFRIERDGQNLTLPVTPLLTERQVFDDTGQPVTDASGDPVTQEVGFVGIGPAYELVQQPPSAVLPAVGDNIVAVGNVILNLPQRLIDIAEAAFGPEQRDPNGPISVVGVGRLAGEIASIDAPVVERAASLVGLVASLNVALFVFNLIPLMPLDGGHVLGALWEGIRRAFAKVFRKPDPGPVDTARLVPITLAVVVILGGMSALLIYADIVKPISIL